MSIICLLFRLNPFIILLANGLEYILNPLLIKALSNGSAVLFCSIHFKLVMTWLMVNLMQNGNSEYFILLYLVV